MVAAAVSDGVDGFLAKRYGWTTELGSYLDPLADKLLLVAVFVSAAWSAIAPWWLAAAAIARDLVIGGGALIFRLWFGPLAGPADARSRRSTPALQILYLRGRDPLRGAKGCRRARGAGGAGARDSLHDLASGAWTTRAFAVRAWSMPARRG